MVAVVWRILSEVDTGQLWVGIPRVGMVDQAPSDVGRTLHMLLEAEVEEGSGHQISQLSVKTQIEVASDNSWLVHVDHLL